MTQGFLIMREEAQFRIEGFHKNGRLGNQKKISIYIRFLPRRSPESFYLEGVPSWVSRTLLSCMAWCQALLEALDHCTIKIKTTRQKRKSFCFCSTDDKTGAQRACSWDSLRFLEMVMSEMHCEFGFPPCSV